MENLYEETMRMIAASDMNITRIAIETGMSIRWMHDLMAGRYNDPGVKKIQKLHDYLKARQEQQRLAA